MTYIFLCNSVAKLVVASFVNRKDTKPAVTVKPVLPEDDLGYVKLPRLALPAEDKQVSA